MKSMKLIFFRQKVIYINSLKISRLGNKIKQTKELIKINFYFLGILKVT